MTVRVGVVALVSALSLHAAAVRVSAQTPSMGPVSFLSPARPALAADTTAVRAQGVGIPVVDLLREYLTAKDPQLKFELGMLLISATGGININADYQRSLVAPAADNGMHVNIVAEVSVSKFEGGTVLGIGAGPRVLKAIKGNVAVYGQVLAGILRDSGFTDFMVQPGGGVVYALPGQKFLVTGGIHFPIDFFDGGSQTGTRITGGIAIPFGGN